MVWQRQARVVAVVLAGGQGSRLRPLTLERSKPAVPFGGKWRIIDFVLSNLVHSGVPSIYVLTQYKAQSLLEHLQDAWVRSLDPAASSLRCRPRCSPVRPGTKAPPTPSTRISVCSTAPAPISWRSSVATTSTR